MEGLECLDVSRPSNLIADYTGRQIGKPTGREPIAITQSGSIGDRPDHRPPSMVVGRRAELNVLAEMVDRVRAGGSATILIQGEPGVGKTALLEQLETLAEGFAFIRTEGIQSELQLDYAALHRIVLPFTDRIDQLPARQRGALEAALGLSEHGGSDRFLVGLAVLTLLGDPERIAPLLIVVDDAHWLDRDSMAVLAFVARRLHADRIALVFAMRDSVAATLPTQGLPELHVNGLDETNARKLLASFVSTPIDDRVVTKAVLETRGNPLALAGLARELTALQLAGLSALPDPLPAGEAIEARFARQIQLLPEATQTCLLVAAAEPTKDVGIIARAAEELGSSLAALEAAEENQLISAGNGIEFRHPLIRSAVYFSASGVDRRNAHRALAAALVGEADRDRCAMHRALATVGPDADVASTLEKSASNARARGGYTAETELLIRAADLTPGAPERSRRLLAAAHAAHLGSNQGQAQTLLEAARQGELDEIDRARAQVLAGNISVHLGESTASLLLLEASRSLAPLDRKLSRRALLGSFNAMLSSRQYALGVTGQDLAAVALTALSEGTGDPTVDSILAAIASAYARDWATTAPAIRQALAAIECAPAMEMTEWRYVCVDLPHLLWDPEAFRFMMKRMETAARESGALLALRPSLLGVASEETREGQFSAARTRYAELLDITQAISSVMVPFYALLDVELLAWEGKEELARAKIAALLATAVSVTAGVCVQIANSALAILELSLCRYSEALAAARAILEVDPVLSSYLALPILVEAAMRCGDIASATDALAEIEERAEAAQTPHAMGLMWRSRALAWDDDRSGPAFDSAVDWLAKSPWRTDLARTHLLFGEWLRRRKRRTEARGQLRIAYEMFESMGAEVLAARARMELQLTGEQAAGRNTQAATELTVRELQIARLAADRLTSREIASRLFISPHTVEHHLKKVFQKLGVSSRRDLATALSTGVEFDG